MKLNSVRTRLIETAFNIRVPRLIVQYGMKRSGNHAITNWLLPKLNAIYFNNIVPMEDIIRGRKTVPDLDRFASWFAHRQRDDSNSLQTLYKDISPMFKPVYVSLEDFPLNLSAFAVNNPVNILIIRSFENMMSSRIHKAFKTNMAAYPREMSPVLESIVNTWKNHARSYLDANEPSAGRVAIYFDRWTQDPIYREAICNRLGLASDDVGINQVSQTGGGSSFDGTKFDGDAEKMDIARRKDCLAENERLLLEQVTDDKELQNLISLVSNADPIEKIWI
ncbi:MAG: hypothetical protein R3F50_20330 [Gammaproteobacteria bacterium]